MRKVLMPALLAIMASVACHGTAAADPDEEVQAARLIHGLANGALVADGKALVTQLSSSPATFKVGDKFSDPDQAKETGIISVSNVGKCTYQSEYDFTRIGGYVGNFTIDLTGLTTDGPSNQPDDGRFFRVLKGAAITCNSFKSSNASTKDSCNELTNHETIFAVATISDADFSAMATKFKQDFCQ